MVIPVISGGIGGSSASCAASATAVIRAKRSSRRRRIPATTTDITLMAQTTPTPVQWVTFPVRWCHHPAAIGECHRSGREYSRAAFVSGSGRDQRRKAEQRDHHHACRHVERAEHDQPQGRHGHCDMLGRRA